ncbi:MAG: hypothetical protein LBT85_02255 [Bifidobacteriaceae bacterium]|jgi:hypothetical protein|nr:hypothetical protein [Bifidobacteriaceae bacterium]
MYSLCCALRFSNQDYASFFNRNLLNTIEFSDDKQLSKENINSRITGNAVQYLTKFLITRDKEKAFFIPLLGAERCNKIDEARMRLDNIVGLDDKSIKDACRLAGYELCYKINPKYGENNYKIRPDEKTVSNIRIMVNRSLYVLRKYGPVLLDDIAFNGAFTNKVNSASGDYLTPEGFWNFANTLDRADNLDILQLLSHWIMGLHSVHKNKFKNVKYLVIFSPRLNKLYYIEVDKIGQNTISSISKRIIGYNK